MSIYDATITVFTSQILFVGLRTWNILAISRENLLQTIFSGALLHLIWLVTISIGVTSASAIIEDWNMDYIPVIVGSTLGGAIGTTLSLKQKYIINFIKRHTKK